MHRNRVHIFFLGSLILLNAGKVLAEVCPEARLTQRSSRASFSLQSLERTETWWGEDKIEHFFVSGMIMGFGFFFFREPLRSSDRLSLFGSASFAVSAGLLKEYRDLRTRNGVASLKDLVANVLGVGFTIFLIKLK